MPGRVPSAVIRDRPRARRVHRSMRQQADPLRNRSASSVLGDPAMTWLLIISVSLFVLFLVGFGMGLCRVAAREDALLGASYGDEDL